MFRNSINKAIRKLKVYLSNMLIEECDIILTQEVVDYIQALTLLLPIDDHGRLVNDIKKKLLAEKDVKKRFGLFKDIIENLPTIPDDNDQVLLSMDTSLEKLNNVIYPFHATAHKYPEYWNLVEQSLFPEYAARCLDTVANLEIDPDQIKTILMSPSDFVFICEEMEWSGIMNGKNLQKIIENAWAWTVLRNELNCLNGRDAPDYEWRKLHQSMFDQLLVRI